MPELQDLPNEIILHILSFCTDNAAVSFMTTCLVFREFIRLHPLSKAYDFAVIKSYPMFYFTGCNYTGVPRVSSLDFIIPETITFLKLNYDSIYKIPSWIQRLYLEFVPGSVDLRSLITETVVLDIRIRKQNGLEIQNIKLPNKIDNLGLKCAYLNMKHLNCQLNKLSLLATRIINFKAECKTLEFITNPTEISFCEVRCDSLIVQNGNDARFLTAIKLMGLKSLTIFYDMTIQKYQQPPIPVRVDITETTTIITPELLDSMKSKAENKLIFLTEYLQRRYNRT